MLRILLPWTVRTLALIALGLSAYLWWVSATTQTAIGCDAFGGFDCDAALASPWAKWFGVPVAAGGALCYLAALVGSFLAVRSGATSRIGWRMLEVAAPLAVGAAVWFTFLQITALGSFCLYCLATHLCGVAIAIAVLVWRHLAANGEHAPRSVGISPVGVVAPQATNGAPPPLGLPTVAGVLGIVALAAGQIVGAPSAIAEFEAQLPDEIVFTQSSSAADTGATEETGPVDAETAEPNRRDPSFGPPRKQGGSRKVSFLNGRLSLDTYEQAVLGSPEAPHVLIEMMDYACPHCREFHEKLTAALRRFDGQIAVVVMPIPGEISCNPYVKKARPASLGACYAAKLALAVAQLKPEEFERFHEWMLTDDKIPNRTAMLIEARKYVDGGKLSVALRDEDGALAARIKNYVDLGATIARQGRFGLPSQILGDKVVSGPSDSLEALCKSWAEAFGLDTPTEEIPF